MPPRSSHRLLVAVALSTTILMTIYAATTIASVSSKKTSSQGAAIMLCWDRACKNATASIDWGTIMSGASNVKTFYVRNEGSTPLKLILITKNWNPAAAANCLSVSWNLEGVTLNPKGILKATVTLKPILDQTLLSTFSFDIDLTGTQT